MRRPSHVKQAAVVALALALTFPAFGSTARGANSRTARCHPKGSHVWASAHYYSVLLSRRGDLVSCNRETGRVVNVADPTNSDDFFREPAVDVAGRVVAFAGVFTEDIPAPYVDIVVADAASGRQLRRYIITSTGDDEGDDEGNIAKIGSIQVKRNRSVAWIQCPVGNTAIDGDPRPNCVRPGRSVNAVFKHDSTTPGHSVKLIAKGKGIDPRSLELTGGRLTWLDNGRTHSATLR